MKVIKNKQHQQTRLERLEGEIEVTRNGKKEKLGPPDWAEKKKRKKQSKK